VKYADCLPDEPLGDTFVLSTKCSAQAIRERKQFFAQAILCSQHKHFERIAVHYKTFGSIKNDKGFGLMIYSLHFGDICSENVHSFVAKLVLSIHARLVCPSGEILATQFAEHVRIHKGHGQLSVPCDDKRGQKLPTSDPTSDKRGQKLPLSVLNAMQTIFKL
jgi:hypothetical protein